MGRALLAVVVMAACGREPARVDTLAQAILNGTDDTSPEAYPGVVLVQIPPNLCSGTLISVQGTTGWVLTAAHCVMDPVRYLRTSARATEVLIGPDRASQRSFTVTGEFVDPRYTLDRVPFAESLDPQLGGLAFDLALVSFTGADSTLAPLVIPPLAQGEDTLSVGAELEVVGFGYTSPTGPLPQIRQKAQVHVAQLFNTPRVGAAMVVIDERDGGPGTCLGDSGGPGIVDLGGGQLRVAAVTSYASNLDDVPCRELSALQRVSTEVADFIAPVLAGTPLPAPATCLTCTFARTQPGSACYAALSAALNLGASAYRTCLATTDETACRSQFPDGGTGFDAYWSCVLNDACPTLCKPDERAYFECHEDVDGVGDCTACTYDAPGCCALEAKCQLDAACEPCLSRVDLPASCATNATFQQTLACVHGGCASACDRYFAYAGLPDAGVPDAGLSDAGQPNDAGTVTPTPAPGCGCGATSGVAPLALLLAAVRRRARAQRCRARIFCR